MDGFCVAQLHVVVWQAWVSTSEVLLVWVCGVRVKCDGVGSVDHAGLLRWCEKGGSFDASEWDVV